MKQIIIRTVITFTIAVLITSISMALCNAEMYPNYGVVSELDYKQDIVYFTDFTGNIWSFYGIEDWQIGDIVAVIMDNMNTMIIYDDEIIMAVYCGRVIK